jgi:hypothetical protein
MEERIGEKWPKNWLKQNIQSKEISGKNREYLVGKLKLGVARYESKKSVLQKQK